MCMRVHVGTRDADRSHDVSLMSRMCSYKSPERGQAALKDGMGSVWEEDWETN
jgi:hypothetical protein